LWKSSWWVAIHHDGKRRMKRVGPTKADRHRAKKVAEQVNAAIIRSEYRPDQTGPEPLPFDLYATEWLRREVTTPAERHVEGALSLATAALHKRHVNRYLAPFFGSRDIRSLGVAEVQDLFDHCIVSGRPPSMRSVEMVLGTLRRILAHAEAREEIPRNPVEKWKRARGRRRRSAGYRIDPENVLD
jgi:hypothetical protein